jgi:magnesium transporter
MTNNHNHPPLFPNISFKTQNIHEYETQLQMAPVVDLVDLLESRGESEKLLIFTVLPHEKAVKVFEYLPIRTQKFILGQLPPPQLARLLNALSPDDRTALLEEMPAETMNVLLQYLSPEEKNLSIRLLGYPENSVGRLMTPDYISIKMDWTVEQVLGFIRETGKDSETINVIYAVDEHGTLIDDFRIRQFLLAPLTTKVSDLADHHFVALNVDDNEEKAVQIFRKNNRVALPVIDANKHLLGIVTFDDILSVSVAEDTEDMQKIGGVEALDEPYMTIPFFRLIKKRVGWLVILFLGEMLTASAMGYFEDELSKAVVLALFLPLIISSGGNAGSQASTLIVRALALGEITLRDWWRILRREIFQGLLLGLVLGTIGFFRVSIWSYFSTIYGVHWLLIAYTIFLSLIGVVFWGAIAGALMPIVLKRCGFDPAVSSAPFLATLVDVTGLIIYFTIAIAVLSGTLL